MSRAFRLCVAGLITVASSGVVIWVAGAFVLPTMLRSDADRWVVAAALGGAVAAIAALCGHSWATREDASASDDKESSDSVDGRRISAKGQRSIVAGGDISGIASTGNDAMNVQQQ